MKAIIVEETRIHCDTCHHEFEGVPADWHNKPCPACSAPEIITDKDMAVWTGMRNMMAVVNGLVGEVPDDHGGGHISFSYSTAGLASNT